ncbi:DUF7079 family protein [Paraburkholderia bannensis]|uniref:DUF7079 family protein n=1 Tax=Paraburkholderia bannensis TaxID=765414 RepID=UPI002AB79004|nr:hypothetical protein [Paraburkholderia bannensis]
MTEAISLAERRECWCIMSDMFVDNEVDYRNVAEQLVRHCSNMPLSMLKRVLYEEVTPALGGIASTPAPPVWLMWDPDEVVSLVSSMLARRESSFLYRIGNDFWRLHLRNLARDLWRSLEQELQVVHANGLGS